MISIEKSTRNYNLDILKILAIFFVCSYHFSLYSVGFNPLKNVTFINILLSIFFTINATCIPLFFLVNGALLLNKKYEAFDIKKHIIRCVTMFIALVVWRAITIVYLVYINGIEFSSVDSITWINSIFLLVNFPGVKINHFWFIPMLISIYAIYPFFSYILNSEDKKIKKYLYVFMGFLLALMIIGGDFVVLQKVIFKTVFADFGGVFKHISTFPLSRCGYLFYFLLGGILFKNREKVKSAKWYILVSMLIVGALILFCYWFFQNTYWDYVYDGYNLIPGVLMSVSLFVLSLKIPNEKVHKHKFLSVPITILGRNTLAVYYTHWILGQTIFTYVLHTVGRGVLENIIKAICFIIIGTLFGELLKRIPIIKNLVK